MAHPLVLSAVSRTWKHGRAVTLPPDTGFSSRLYYRIKFLGTPRSVHSPHPFPKTTDKLPKGSAFDEPADVVCVLGRPGVLRDAPAGDKLRGPFLWTSCHIHCYLFPSGYTWRACCLFPFPPGLPVFRGLASTHPRRDLIHADPPRNPPQRPPTTHTLPIESHPPLATAGNASSIHFSAGRFHDDILPGDSLLCPVIAYFVVFAFLCIDGYVAHHRSHACTHGSPDHVLVFLCPRPTTHHLLPGLRDLVV